MHPTPYLYFCQTARKELLASIFCHFPRIHAFIWVPSVFDTSDGHHLHPGRVASKFLIRCPTLRRFVFVGPDVQDIIPSPRYVSYMKVKRKELYVEGRLERFEDTWKDGAVFFDREDYREGSNEEGN